jgi:hypothetical protein
MHKGEFYTLLPKDAKDIMCTVEVFKKKSARCRSKPRTVSLQGREDDKVLYTSIHNSVEVARYVVPARRKKQANVLHSNNQRTELGSSYANYGKEARTIFVADVPMQQLVVPEEIKPTFRTPCNYIMVGSIIVSLA